MWCLLSRNIRSPLQLTFPSLYLMWCFGCGIVMRSDTCFRNGSALDVPLSIMRPWPEELFLPFSSGNYCRRGKGREMLRIMLKWISKMKNSVCGTSRCKMIHILHTACQWGAAVPLNFSLDSLESNLSICLTDGCHWEKSLEAEFTLYAFHFGFLFQDRRAQYHIELTYRYSKNHRAWLLTYIRTHWTSYRLLLKKKKLLCRKCFKISFKVKESSHVTVSGCQIQPMPFIFWLPFAYSLSIINTFFSLITVKCKLFYALLIYIYF